MDGRSAGAGSLGPRLAGRLTAELILRSPQYMNCINLYALDLRGNKIGAIENTGATENQFDCIDLSDNAIVRLEGFSRLPRLKVLLLNSNRITRIGKSLDESVANLDTLVLTNNKLQELKDLEPLRSLKHLTTLSLMENPVTKKPHYRLFVIARLPKLKLLDFKKIKQKERLEAQEMFGEKESKAAAGAEGAKTFEPDEELEAAQAKLAQARVEAEADTEAEPPAEGEGAKVRAAPTAEQLTAVKAAIANAQTLDEVRRLEQALTSGHLPSEFRFDGAAAANGGGGPEAMDEG